MGSTVQILDRLDAEPGGIERCPIVRPSRHQRGVGVVEQVDVARSASAGDDLVEGDTPAT